LSCPVACPICWLMARQESKLLKDPEIKDYQLVAKDAIQGPDFPTGGQIISTNSELREMYATGQGTVKVRATHKIVETKKKKVIQIISVPYAVNKAELVERMSDLVYSGKLPLVEDVRDVSTEDIRIDLPLKKDADPKKVLAYLYKNTRLQNNFNVNMTCLVPTENPEVGAPNRLSLKEILWHFLHFRLEVITRRLENELAALEKRIHLLQGFADRCDSGVEAVSTGASGNQLDSRRAREQEQTGPSDSQAA